MLHDSPILVAGSEIERELIAEGKRGETLPLSPTIGQEFELTAQDGVNPAGLYVYVGSGKGWVLQENSLQGSKFYDIGLTVFDRPKSNVPVCKHLAVRAFFILPEFDRSLARATQVSTDQYQFKIEVLEVDGSTRRDVGTLTFAAGAATGVFAGTTTDLIPVLRGETLIITSAETRDATLRDVDITIAGQLASTI